MDTVETVEVRLLKYVFRFRRLRWREELAIRDKGKTDRRRLLLRHALTEVSGLPIKTAEEAMRLMDALPITIVHRAFVVYRGSLPEPRLFTTVGLYRAPEPNKFVRQLEKAAEERETIMDRVEQEMERKFGRKELEEQREIERQMMKNSGMRGATKATPDPPGASSEPEVHPRLGRVPRHEHHAPDKRRGPHARPGRAGRKGQARDNRELRGAYRGRREGRPLLVDGRQVGWVRGMHPQERKVLRRWVRDPHDFISLSLQHATTLPKGDIEEMQSFEVSSLVEVVRRMGDYDMSLYPYLPAFVTTAASEAMWYGKGETLTSFESKAIAMPDGSTLRLLSPPDHSRMWATLCTYREQAKKRLEENFNALFIVRPWAGKSADPIGNDLKRVARSLETDSMEPWEKIVAVRRQVDVNDGWGHPGDSVEDLKRELRGMMEGDKHERLMEAWQKQMTAEAEAKRHELDEIRRKRGITEPGITSETIEILTDAQVRARQAALQQGKLPGAVPRRESFELDGTAAQLDKISRYR